MIKTNIKMRVTPEQSRKVQEICFSNGIYWAGENKDKVRIYSNYLYIRGLITHDTSNNFIYFNDAKEEEIDADLFIKTNGTCEETYLAKYTSQPKDLESALKKIENLHIALKKKVDKNKNQALEITNLLEQKKDLETIANVSQIKLHTIEEQIKKAYLDRDFAIAFNQKLKDENRILKDKNSYQVHRIENLEAQLDSKDTIISYLESKLK